MSSRTVHRRLLASAAVAAILAPAAVHAQSAPSVSAAQTGDAGDIIITATRQAESLSRVPLSVSAFSRETLDQRGVRDFSDIARQTPGIVLESTNTTTNISIRGINSAVGASTTGIYIDDTPIQIRALGYGGGNTYPAIFDLDRVEVLRGPQGTLFGAGSQGGTIRFISPDASLTDISAYGRAELAMVEHGGLNYEIGAALGGPLIDGKLGIRASGYYRRDGGFIDRVRFEDRSLVESNANYTDTYVGRVAMTWAPTDNLEIRPSFYYQNIYINDTGSSWDNIRADFSQPDAPFSDYDNGVFLTGNRVQEDGRDKFFLPAINVQYAFPYADLIAIGSYFDREQTFNRDYTTFDQSLFTGITLPIFPDQSATSAFVNSQKNWTAEVRLQSNDRDARLSWVVGGFFQRAEQLAIQQVDDPFLFEYAPFLIPFFPPLVDGRLIYDQETTTVDRQIAIFGQVNWKLIDRLTLTLGLRYGETRFDINSFAQGPVVGPPVTDVGRQTETPFTPKFGADFQINENHLVYLSVSKGFRPGGYNPQVGQCGFDLGQLGYPDGRPPLYDSDSVWSYEVGAKSKLFNGALGVQASVYQIDWSNIQQAVQLGNCGFQFTTNLGSARSRGFDLQAQLQVMDGLSVQAEVGYTNAEYQETIFGGPSATSPLVTEGNNILAPPWTVAVHGQYEFDIADNQKAYIRADYSYRAEQTSVTPGLDPNNGGIDPTLTLPPAYNDLSFRAGVRLWGADASFFVTNALDQNVWAGRRSRDNNNATIFRSNIVRPRTFGLTVAYRY